MYPQIKELLKQTHTIYAVFSFNHSVQQRFIDKYYMPGYVEDTASTIKSKIDLVPVLMSVMSLTLNIGTKKKQL